MLLLPPLCCAIDALPSSLLVEDLERNEGSPSRPYFVTPSLMKLLMEHKTNKKQQESQLGAPPPVSPPAPPGPSDTPCTVLWSGTSVSTALLLAFASYTKAHTVTCEALRSRKGIVNNMQHFYAKIFRFVFFFKHKEAWMFGKIYWVHSYCFQY